jgi:hypothetical protein
MGTAPIGGSWTTVGPAANFSVRNGQGIMSVPPGAIRQAYLPGAVGRDLDVVL